MRPSCSSMRPPAPRPGRRISSRCARSPGARLAELRRAKGPQQRPLTLLLLCATSLRWNSAGCATGYGFERVLEAARDARGGRGVAQCGEEAWGEGGGATHVVAQGEELAGGAEDHFLVGVKARQAHGVDWDVAVQSAAFGRLACVSRNER